jgi:WD40 repeat protein
MARLFLVHPGATGCERDVLAQLARALRAAGHELVCSWMRGGIGGGQVADFEAQAAAADRLVLIEPLKWWGKGEHAEAWQPALRRRLEHALVAGLAESFAVIADHGASAEPGGPLAQLPTFALPKEWTKLCEHLARPRLAPELRCDDRPRPPRAPLPSREIVAALDAAVEAALPTGGFVWLRGAAGSGKSVALAAWLARREAEGLHTACHVARPGLEWTVDPEVVLAKIAWQVMGEPAPLARLHEHLAAREGEAAVVVIDGLEHLVHAHSPAALAELRRTVQSLPAGAQSLPAGAQSLPAGPQSLPAGVVVVAASRPLAPGLLELDPTIDLDAEPWRAIQAELVSRLVQRAQVGSWARPIRRAAAGNPAVAVALLELEAAGSLPEQLGDELPLPPAITADYERSWTRMLARAGDRQAALVSALAVAVALGSMPAALLELALDPEQLELLWSHAAEWLRIEGERVSLVHDLLRRFLAPELDPGDPAPHLRILEVAGCLRARGALDEDTATYLAHHEQALAGEAGWLGWIDKLVTLAGEGQLEAKLAGAHELVGAEARTKSQLMLGLARRRSSLIAREPEALPALLWTELAAHGLDVHRLREDFEWGSRLPPIRLRNALTRLDRCYRILDGHRGRVRGCAIDAAGQRAMTVTSDGELSLWSISTGKRRLYEDIGLWSDACAMTPNGALGVTAANQRVTLWDLDRGEPLRHHEDHADSTEAVAVSVDGEVVISGDRSGRVIVWEVGRDRRTPLGGHRDRVTRCAITPDARLAITGGDDKRARIWDLVARERLYEFERHPYNVSAVAISAAGDRAISVCIGEARVWDLGEGKLEARYEQQGMSAKGCVLVNDERELLIAESEERVTRWCVADGKTEVCHLAHGDNLSGIAASPDGRWYITSGDDGLARVWRDADVAELDPEGYVLPINSMAPTADGRGFWVAGGGEGLRRIELDDGRERERFGTDGSIFGVAEAQGRLVTVGTSQEVCVRRIADDEKLATWKPDSEWLRACAVHGDGQRLAVAGDGKRVYCSTLEGEDRRTIGEHDLGWIHALAWCADGRLVSVCNRGELAVWDVDARESGVRYASETCRGMYALVLDAEGRRAYVGGQDGALEVVDLHRGQQLGRFEGHAEDVQGLALRERDELLISAGTDACVRVWDSETFTELARLDTPYPLRALILVGDSIVAGDSCGNCLVFEVDWDRLRS